MLVFVCNGKCCKYAGNLCCLNFSILVLVYVVCNLLLVFFKEGPYVHYIYLNLLIEELSFGF